MAYFIMSLEVQDLGRVKATLITKEMLEAILQGKIKIDASKKAQAGSI